MRDDVPPLAIQYAMITSRPSERFELVKIAFKEALRGKCAGTAIQLGNDVVRHADAVLAEMEKETLVLNAKEPATTEGDGA